MTDTMTPSFEILPRGFLAVPLKTMTAPPATHTNSYLIGHRAALIVDPGTDEPHELEKLISAIESLHQSGGHVVAVFLTHHHPDHVGGVVPLVRKYRLSVAAHAETFSRLEIHLDSTIPRQIVHDKQNFTIDPELTLTALATPGHAPGHLCLFEPQQKILISGDVILGQGTSVIAPPDGDMKQFLETLEQLLRLNPELVLPAHGPLLRDGSVVIKQLVAHRLKREAAILAALEHKPLPLSTVTARAYPEISPAQLPLAHYSALAHLLKLQSDGKAQSLGEGLWALTTHGSFLR